MSSCMQPGARVRIHAQRWLLFTLGLAACAASTPVRRAQGHLAEARRRAALPEIPGGATVADAAMRAMHSANAALATDRNAWPAFEVVIETLLLTMTHYPEEATAQAEALEPVAAALLVERRGAPVELMSLACYALGESVLTQQAVTPEAVYTLEACQGYAVQFLAPERAARLRTRVEALQRLAPPRPRQLKKKRSSNPEHGNLAPGSPWSAPVFDYGRRS